MISSDSSEDDENFYPEAIEKRDFKAETKLIVANLLPKRSRSHYERAYAAFLKWMSDNKTSEINEDVLIVYFKELSKKWKPPTLWSHWSKLRTTLNLRHQINLNDYPLLKGLLKHVTKGYKPKKSLVLSWNEIRKFIKESDDRIYLAIKVILMLGYFGALRCQEIANLSVKDVVPSRNLDDDGEQYTIHVRDTKNDYPRQFVIGGSYYETMKKYVLLRPDNLPAERFLVQYLNGRCTRQFIGKNKISDVPKTVALYLNLENPSDYTGHCLRRSAATAAANARLDFTKIKQLGGWRSDTVAQGYIDNSRINQEDIFKSISSTRHPNSNQQNNQQELATASTSTINTINDGASTSYQNPCDDYVPNNKCARRMPFNELHSSNLKKKMMVGEKFENNQQELDTASTSTINTVNDGESTSHQNPCDNYVPNNECTRRMSFNELHSSNLKRKIMNESPSAIDERSNPTLDNIINECIDKENIVNEKLPMNASSGATFQNCEIHNLIINHNYNSNSNAKNV